MGGWVVRGGGGPGGGWVQGEWGVGWVGGGGGPGVGG